MTFTVQQRGRFTLAELREALSQGADPFFGIGGTGSNLLMSESLGFQIEIPTQSNTRGT